MTHLNLRKKFYDYFKSKKHTIVESSSLVPIDDPSLLFTTAGMLQFKPLYAGIKTADYTRAVSIQKCFRLSDLENIGRTARHHTFFEMFGNFSFSNDYFKKEAIEFAWEFSTEVIKLDKNRIYVSVFETDDEAYKIWNEHIGLPKERIVRLGKKDNFWGPAGDSGACGPCSELYIDMGEDKGCGKEGCFVGCDCERYLEYWNLVFNEFFQDVDGKQTRLPKVGIDTGMGLERLCAIVQGVDSNYKTDVVAPIVMAVASKLNVKYEKETEVKLHLIADHLRALVFVLSEGVIPSNDGRGYVLRRLIRRALKSGADLGYKNTFLNELTGAVLDVFREVYPYLVEQEANVKKILLSEEKKFYNTLSSALNRLHSMMESNSSKVITGSDAFLLFDTFGLPLEITIEEAEEQGFTVDIDGFKTAMEKQKEMSRGDGVSKKSKFDFIKDLNVEYVGEDYNNLANGVKAKVIAIYENDSEVQSTKNKAYIITDKTCFYGEMGGQVGDTGYIETKDKAKIKVENTNKHNNTTILTVDASGYSLAANDEVVLFIDIDRRNSVRKNHTATHVLQKVLENVLGSHVNQAGSYVCEKYLRFDFTHPNSISEEELTEIEYKVNEVVFKSMPVVIEYMDKDKAIKSGAKALFGEKYGDTVRTLNIGNGFSFELCGGSHITNTSEIGYFHIVSECSISSGVRRIEAITGLTAAREASETFRKVKDISSILGAAKSDELIVRAEKLTADIKKLQKDNKALKTGANANTSFIENFTIENGIKHYILHFEEDAKTVREYADTLKERVKDHIAIITSTHDGANSVIVQVSKDLSTKIKANDIIKDILSLSKGRGGGKETFAQGSIENIESVKDKLKNILAEKVFHIKKED